MRGRNDVRFTTWLDGQHVSNFKLKEFENRDGLAMVHSTLLLGLEQLRRDLSIEAQENVWVIITDGVRTQDDLDRLASRLGWTDEGGAVARDSKHLAKYGGIAADLVAVVARTKVRVPQETVGRLARRYFDFVKDDYGDGHVHVDQRDKSRR